ncbi:unnamed protein product [Dicrocoelium dendriticum]|nr:unnamed protein product [Dicrocoelium dendriticum]
MNHLLSFFSFPFSILLCNNINQRSYDGERLQASSLPLHMTSAYSYDTESFTNWVPGFKALLDVILYSADFGLKCVRTLPVPRQDQVVHTPEAPCETMNMSSKGEPVTGLDVYDLPNKELLSDQLLFWPTFICTTRNFGTRVTFVL